MRKPRKWAHPLAIEREYIRAVRRYADATNEAIRVHVLPVLETLNLDAVEDIPQSVGWYERLRLATVAALNAATAPTEGIAFLVRSFGERIRAFNGDQFRRVLRSAYGVDIFVREPALADTLAVFEAENIKLIKSVPTQALDKMHGKIVAAVRKGQPLKNVREMVENEFGATRSRAELIARDQTSKLNGKLTEERQTAAGIESYVWETSRDERVRETHLSNAGKTFQWDKPPIDTGHPGEDYQCFPGSTQVNGFPSLQKLYRRGYAGELTEFICDDGTVLVATPNHPILTLDGLQPIQSLNVGDYVVGRSDKARGIIQGHGQNLITTIQQVFDSVNLGGVTQKVPGSIRSQFHGDGSDGEIDVISTDGLLVGEGDFSIREKLFELRLSDSDKMLADRFLASDSVFFERFHRVGTLAREVGRAGLVVSSILRHLSPFEFFRFALTADRNAGFDEPATDDRAGNPQVFRNSIFAFSCLIHGQKAIGVQRDAIMRGAPKRAGSDLYPGRYEMFTDAIGIKAYNRLDGAQGSAIGIERKRVVQVSNREFFGHVYNLETVNGHYTANLVEVGNCRCTARAILPLLSDLVGLEFGT